MGVFGVVMLMAGVAGLAYLMGYGHCKAALHLSCRNLMDDLEQQLRAPPYRSDHVNCTICAFRRATVEEAASQSPDDHPVRGD